MARTCPGPLARRTGIDPGAATGWRARLDSGGAPGLGSAMAPDMIPPAGAAEFLSRQGWGGATILPLAGDASFRRYFRVVDGARRAVLMDAPPPHEDPRPFIEIAQWLVAHGFAAPNIHGIDLDQGLVLIEDFGDDRMREAVDADPSREQALYESAIDILVALHAEDAVPAEPYDRQAHAVDPARPRRKGAGDRDGDGRRVGQAHAPAHRDASEAADRGGGANLARSCARPASFGRGEARRAQRALSCRRARSASEQSRRRH